MVNVLYTYLLLSYMSYTYMISNPAKFSFLELEHSQSDSFYLSTHYPGKFVLFSIVKCCICYYQFSHLLPVLFSLLMYCVWQLHVLRLFTNIPTFLFLIECPSIYQCFDLQSRYMTLLPISEKLSLSQNYVYSFV